MGCASAKPSADDAPPRSTASRRRLSMATAGAGAGAGQPAAAPANGGVTGDTKRRRLSVIGGGAAAGGAQATTATPASSKLGRSTVANTQGNRKVPGLPVVYAAYSRPGNDPMKREKENQDSMNIIEEFAGDAKQMFITVMDGHGPNGAFASQYCREKLPELIVCPSLKSEPFVAMSNACIETNRQLCESDIDVYVSGSTCIASILRGNKLYVANIGDSRAVLGRMNDKGQIRALELSNDQKPDRPDEKKRILERGGRVFEWGVPRVWLKDVDMPGLAMARSFGDIAAESVGVFAEPELSKVTLNHTHPFLIWASDGVWEFISSQEACEIVNLYYSAGPQKACDQLVAESVKRWNMEEDVVDDTTCVILFLSYTKDWGMKKVAGTKDAAASAAAPAASNGATTAAAAGSGTSSGAGGGAGATQ